MIPTAYLNGTDADLVLVAWVSAHYSNSSRRVIVTHVSRKDATVPAGDLVNTQVVLRDGRFLQIGHDSTKPATVFILCEKAA